MRLPVVALCCLAGLPAVPATGQERIANLPYGALELEVRGQTYYYANGYFYRREDRLDDNDYLRVEPPLGAEIGVLPRGSTCSRSVRSATP